MCKREIIWRNGKNYGMNYWVIRTTEETPRYIEVILQDKGIIEYGLVYNVNYGKVWKRVTPPYEVARKFEEITGLKASFQEVDEKAFNHYKSYEEYFNGKRKLTREEIKQLKKELAEYKREHYPRENKKF